MAGGHGDVFSKPQGVTSTSGGGGVFAPSPEGHGDVFSKPREVKSPSPRGHGDVFSKPRGVISPTGGHG